MAYKKDATIYITLDMRFPVKQNVQTCLKPLEGIKDDDNEFILSGRGIDPLYFDINSPFIQALDKAYRKVTNDNDSKMLAIGGGTYAKAIKNIIAFGCQFLDENNHIHESNEELSIDSMKKQIIEIGKK